MVFCRMARRRPALGRTGASRRRATARRTLADVHCRFRPENPREQRGSPVSARHIGPARRSGEVTEAISDGVSVRQPEERRRDDQLLRPAIRQTCGGWNTDMRGGRGSGVSQEQVTMTSVHNVTRRPNRRSPALLFTLRSHRYALSATGVIDSYPLVVSPAARQEPSNRPTNVEMSMFAAQSSRGVPRPVVVTFV